MEDLFEKVRTQINIADVLEQFGVHIDRNGKGLCPFHSDSNPSLSIDKKSNRFKCFACDAGGSAIDFVAKLKGIEPFEAVKLIAEMNGVKYDSIEEKAKHKDSKAIIKDYFTACIKDIGCTDYFLKRGLNPATISKFKLGYDKARNAVVIPYNSKLDYYQTRSIVEKTFYKPKTEDAGVEPLYCGEALTVKNKTPIFVVESPICAMSINQCGGLAVSTCGTGWRKLLEVVTKKKPSGTLILCYDNDDAGRKASAELLQTLKEAKINAIEFNVAKECKDPNELLMKNPTALAVAVEDGLYQAKKAFTAWEKMFDMAELEARDIKPLEWLIDGILPVGLVMIASPPKLGKSWLMLQMCMAIVKGTDFWGYKTHKNECIYLALEDNDGRFRYRKRKLYGTENNPKGFSGFTESKKMKKVSTGFIEQLEELLFIKPRTKLVVIDTFQTVRGVPKRSDQAYSIDSEDLKVFRDFVNDHGVGILLVHHTRKMVDENDPFNNATGSIGITGVVDSTMILGKKKRTDPTCSLRITGRDTQEQELEVAMDRDTNVWSKIESTEESKVRAEREVYEKDTLVITIKELMKRNHGYWKGTSRELSLASIDLFGSHYLGTDEQVGKKISALEFKLRQDKIQHTKLRNRVHEFREITPTLFNYLQAPKEDDEDNV
jgi:hypothetical protein